MSREMCLFASGDVDDDVRMTLFTREGDGDSVSITFGKEQLTLEFCDAESLERLRDLADRGAAHLRTMNKESHQGAPGC